MANAVIVTLAEEVKDDLNEHAGSFAVSFVAERAYYPVKNLEEVGTLKVHVATSNWSKTAAARSLWSTEYEIEIGLQYRPAATAGKEAQEKFDLLMKLLEEIGDHYEDTRPTLANCVLIGVSYGPGGTGVPYVPTSINDKNLFVGIIRLTFRKYR